MATRYEDENHRRDSNNWHLDKKVPVSLIIAMIAQIVAVVWAIADIKKDTELNKQAIEQLREADKFLMSETQRNLQIIQGHYARLEAKLDRLIERESVTDKK
jgi:hypothetical protein